MTTYVEAGKEIFRSYAPGAYDKIRCPTTRGQEKMRETLTDHQAVISRTQSCVATTCVALLGIVAADNKYA